MKMFIKTYGYDWEYSRLPLYFELFDKMAYMLCTCKDKKMLILM